MEEIQTDLQQQGYESTRFTSLTKASRLHDDIKALASLFAASFPPQRRTQPTKCSAANYMFRAASGIGFWSSLSIDLSLRMLRTRAC